MKWVKIKGYVNYEVSECGQVRNTNTGRILKQDETGVGYYRVTLSKGNVQNRQSVHRIVAKHYVDNPLDKPMVNHLDGDKKNNHKDNLEWCTCSENFIHAQEIGLRPIGSKRSSALIDEDCVHKVCQMIINGKPRGEILSAGIHKELKKHMVDNIRRGRSWKHISKLYF